MKTITIKDIAKLANVSSKTVSKVINNKSGVKVETKEKILTIMKEQNYSINYNAKRLSESKSRHIAVITNISKKYPLNKNQIIMQYILEKIVDYDVIVYNDINDLKLNPYGGIAKGYYDGILLLNPKNEDEIKFVKESEIPFVISGQFGDYSYVGTDQFQSGYIATKHLLTIGCKDIVFLLRDKNSLTANKKIEGYIKALVEENITVNAENIKYDYYKPEDVEKFLITKYYMDEMPDAILIDSDYPVFGAIRAFDKLKIKCPKDIKVITFGNTFICKEITPSITAITQNLELISEKLIEILINKIEKQSNFNDKLIITAELVVRESTVKI